MLRSGPQGRVSKHALRRSSVSARARQALRFGALALGVALFAPTAHAQEKPVTVLTAHPAAHALVSSLTAGSGVTAKAVQPAKLPASRLASFLSGRGAAGLAEAASPADAVVTFRSFWPDDPLYPHARRANIRIVEIDAGRPLDGALPGIAMLSPPDDRDVYAELGLSPMPPAGEGAAPWLSPTALGRMADVVAADLERLAPSARSKIAENLAGMKRRLIAAKAKADAALGEAPSVTAIALSSRFGYLASDLGLELIGSITAAPNEWTADRGDALKRLIRSREIAVVLLDAEPNADIADAIRQSGARAVVLAQVDGETASPAEIVERNLRLLTEAFAPSK